MSKLIVFAASIAGVGLLVGLAWLLGFRGRMRLDETGLRDLAQTAAPGAAIVRVRMDCDGRAGLAWLGDGRIVTAAALGDRFAVRVWPEAQVRLREDKGTLQVTLPDFGYPGLRLRAVR